ncbi:MAG: MFS transporter, partial [Mesorhizobium sp.]
YLASYYSGGLVGSFVLGQVYDRFGWTTCVVVLVAALTAATIIARPLTAPRV